MNIQAKKILRNYKKIKIRLTQSELTVLNRAQYYNLSDDWQKRYNAITDNLKNQIEIQIRLLNNLL